MSGDGNDGSDGGTGGDGGDNGEPLRGVLLLDGPAMRRWAVEAVRRAVDDGVLSIEHVVINDEVAESLDGDAAATIRRYVDSARDFGAWAPVGAYRSVLVTPPHLEWVPLEDLPWADAERHQATPVPAESFGQELPDDVVDAVAEDVDVAVRFGFGIIKGRILTEPTHGVLSFHHGDVRRYRGRPVGAWEYLHGVDEGGVTLQQLTETLDGGRIVAFESVDLTGTETWPEVERRLYAASDGMLSAGLRSLRSGEEPETVSSEELGPLYSDPDAKNTARFVAMNLLGGARRFLVG